MMHSIFNINDHSAFQEACIETFRYQYENIKVYHDFVDLLKVYPKKVDEITKIPFLPIEVFKKHRVLDQGKPTDFYFQSSGTSNIQTLSKHWIADENLYRESIYNSFRHFIGNPEEYVFLGLLPSYLERKNASLIYMVDFLMQKSEKPENGYFLYNHAELLELLNQFQQEKIILFGVSFALLDFLDFARESVTGIKHLPNLIVIETGGMKGRKDEITKDELLKILQNGFATSKIYSEYSMTELLSQAYSFGENIYQSPNWMKILIRSIEDPFAYVSEERSGAINIIDLANLHSCAFIATQDLGRIHERGQHSIHSCFSVEGRIDHSDIRGCSLLVV